MSTESKELTMEQLQKLIADQVAAGLEPLAATQRRFEHLFIESDAAKRDKDAGIEKGSRFARAVKSIALGRAEDITRVEAAKRLYPEDAALLKALGEATGSAGGFLVPTEYSREIIELLYDRAVVRKAGARVIPMASNTMNVPRLATGATAGYVGENANITKSEQTFEQLQLSAKKLAVLTPISNDLIRDSSPQADAIVRDDIVTAMGLREDLAFIRDDGTSNKPKGILNWVPAANKFNANATINVANVIADLKKSVKLVMEARKGQLVKAAWLFATRTYMFLITQTTGAPERFIWREEMLQGKLLGYPFFVTDQIPVNIGTGSDSSEVYFGDFVDAVIGENRNLEIAVSNEAAYHDGTNVIASFSQDQTVIRAILRHDFALRHDKSFSVMSEVDWS